MKQYPHKNRTEHTKLTTVYMLDLHCLDLHILMYSRAIYMDRYSFLISGFRFHKKNLLATKFICLGIQYCLIFLQS